MMNRRDVNMPGLRGCYGWMADSVCRRFLGLWLLVNSSMEVAQ